MRVCSGLRALIYLILHTLAPILTSRIPLRRNRPHSEGVWEPAAPPGHVRPQERGRVRQNPRFLRIRWEYEPRTFPLRWNDQGRILESFSPDFYLPDLDLFIELTTLKQSLVTKKNRKVRLLRELYPWIHIKIFYGRDFRQLALKYGLEPLTAAR